MKLDGVLPLLFEEHAVSAAPSITMSAVFPDVMLDDSSARSSRR
jgi:hypothetical protein